MLRSGRVGPVIAAVVAAWSTMTMTMTMLTMMAPTTVSAEGRPEAETKSEIEVEFDITGYRCTFEITRERIRSNGTTVVRAVQTGITESSIALMAGTLTVETTTVLRPDGVGRVTGRWTLEPDASTGAIKGTVRGSLTGPDITELESTGRGIRSLHGVKVRMTTTTPVAGTTDACQSDLTFSGSGRASHRRLPAPTGAVVVDSTKDFGPTVADLTAAIENNPNLRLVSTIDHRAEAVGRGLVLGPTTELFFGNPALGTPLMQASQTTGIDLPQKMLIWEDLFGAVRVAYNAPAYLESRHHIAGADAQLQTVGNALAGLAGAATGTVVPPTFDAGTVRRGAGLVEIHTDRSADEAFAAIVEALKAAPPVNVAFAVEHDVNAASIDLDLRPTRLVVFGNPSLGTTLMQTDQSIALDLPQKILVYTNEQGETTIAYNSPRYIANRHHVRGQSAVLDVLAGALANFANAGT